MALDDPRAGPLPSGARVEPAWSRRNRSGRRRLRPRTRPRPGSWPRCSNLRSRPADGRRRELRRRGGRVAAGAGRPATDAYVDPGRQHRARTRGESVARAGHAADDGGTGDHAQPAARGDRGARTMSTAMLFAQPWRVPAEFVTERRDLGRRPGQFGPPPPWPGPCSSERTTPDAARSAPHPDHPDPGRLGRPRIRPTRPLRPGRGDLLPPGGLSVLPDCGHMPHVELPERFATVLSDWLTERRDQPQSPPPTPTTSVDLDERRIMASPQRRTANPGRGRSARDRGLHPAQPHRQRASGVDGGRSHAPRSCLPATAPTTDSAMGGHQRPPHDPEGVGRHDEGAHSTHLPHHEVD